MVEVHGDEVGDGQGPDYLSRDEVRVLAPGPPRRHAAMVGAAMSSSRRGASAGTLVAAVHKEEVVAVMGVEPMMQLRAAVCPDRALGWRASIGSGRPRQPLAWAWR